VARHRRHAVCELVRQTVLDGLARLDLHPPRVCALASRQIRVDSYIAGLILLAAAPCTAMVFVWSQLCKGDPYFTLSQVALNDSIMIVAFAPLVALLLGLSAIAVPWDTLIISVGLYIVVPVILAQLLRRKSARQRGRAFLARRSHALGPYSISALLATLVLLFAFQGQAIVEEPLVIAMLAVPILIQVFFNSGLAYLLNRRLGVAHCCGRPVQPDRREQLLRACRRHRNQPVRISVPARHWRL
jgi:ACR3 family arsenite transporter